MEESAEVVESGIDATGANALARRLLAPREDWATELTTSQLAAGCAQLDVDTDLLEARLKTQKAFLDDARKALCERLKSEGIDQVRVETSEGRRLVHLAAVFGVNVPAEQRGRVLEWLKANHAEMVEEGFNANAFKALLKRTEKEQEGEFPKELEAQGAIKIFRSQEVRFRSSR